MTFQAILGAPFGKLGIQCSDRDLLGITFLAPGSRELPPQNALAREACAQLQAYFDDPAFAIDLPFELSGTHHQCLVWQALLEIPTGETRTYGALAALLGSSARAVGQACGNNPLPIVIPCHRAVSKQGLGGFMHRRDAAALDIKRWLLTHERH